MVIFTNLKHISKTNLKNMSYDDMIYGLALFTQFMSLYKPRGAFAYIK